MPNVDVVILPSALPGESAQLAGIGETGVGVPVAAEPTPVLVQHFIAATDDPSSGSHARHCRPSAEQRPGLFVPLWRTTERLIWRRNQSAAHCLYCAGEASIPLTIRSPTASTDPSNQYSSAHSPRRVGSSPSVVRRQTLRHVTLQVRPGTAISAFRPSI